MGFTSKPLLNGFDNQIGFHIGYYISDPTFAKPSKEMSRLNAKKIKKESGNSTSHSVLVSEVKTSLKTMKKNQMTKKMKMKNQLMKPKIQAARILMI